VPELAEIMRAQPDNVSALRALLDFAENVRPPDSDDEPLTPAQAKAIQDVEESINLLRTTIGNLTDALSAFLPAEQLSQLMSSLTPSDVDAEPAQPTDEQEKTDDPET
jgi:hypothetical protein